MTRSNESVDMIKSVKRENNKICNQYQNRIIVSYQNRGDGGKFTKIMEFKRTTVYQIIKTWLDTYKINAEKRGGIQIKNYCVIYIEK